MDIRESFNNSPSSKVICSYLGGSYSYGLYDPEKGSDRDERGIFLHLEPSKIIGLERFDHFSKQEGQDDIFYWELRHFLNLLRKGNTMAVEMLFYGNWLSIEPEFRIIQQSRLDLIDSERLFKCLMGYTYSERELVLGKRTGQLGGKRKEALEKYGYSYKNLVQYIRLCRAGEVFFQTGWFPVNIRPDQEVGALLWSIKTKSEDYNAEYAVELMDKYLEKLKASFNTIKYQFTFKDEVANDILMRCYLPILNSKS